MIKDDMKEIIEKLNTQGTMKFFDAAKQEQITEFEENNCIKLPSLYKDWLMHSDGGDLFLPSGLQLYGVAHKPLIDVNDNLRPDDNYVVIGALSFGDPIIFKKDSEEIAVYNHEANKIEEDEKFDDFLSFLNSLYDLLDMGE